MSFGKAITKKFSPVTAKLPNMTGVAFGQIFAPTMLDINWSKAKGWSNPEILDFAPLQIHPAASCIHYAVECFEGMKAYRGSKGEIRMFRPDMNIKRLQRSTQRLCFPKFEEEDFMVCLTEWLKSNQSWIPTGEGYSLYIRPTGIGTNENLGIHAPSAIKLFVIGSPVGPYYSSGFKPVKLYVDTEHHRAWPGGTGDCKLGANYAGPMLHQDEAEKKGFQQILWLGPNDMIDEVGAMNFMMVWKNKQGERELITAPLECQEILPGITRDSILSLARQWGEFKVSEKRFSIHEAIEAIEQGRVEEMFGCGTAAIVSPIEGLSFHGKYYDIPLPEHGVTMKALREIYDIQYGKKTSEWSVVIE